MHVKLIDGTGTPAKTDQTILIRGEKIAAVGPSASVTVPPGRAVVDATGQVGDSRASSACTTTCTTAACASWASAIRACFSRPASRRFARRAASIRIRSSISSGRSTRCCIPGPGIVVTGPYLQGAGVGPGAMHPLKDTADARRMVRYWADEGVTWFKAYTQISRADLGAAIRRSAQARREGHGASLLGRIPRGRRTGHRSARARAAHEHRVLPRQEARRLSDRGRLRALRRRSTSTAPTCSVRSRRWSRTTWR